MDLFYMILAGGVGARMHSPELPKQYLKINGEPIIIKTLRNFEDYGLFQAGVICCPVDWIEYTKALLGEYGLNSENVFVISGGKNRSSSVKNGCRFLTEKFNITDDDIVLTHDAVRPFFNTQIIKDNIEACAQYGAANTVMPIYDSVIRTSTGEFPTEHLPRKELYRVQTPQTFTLNNLSVVMNSLTDTELETYTDVASVYSDRGFRVKLVKGSDYNIKITTPFDLAVAETIVKNMP